MTTPAHLGKKLTLGCTAEQICGCRCRACHAGTIMLITCHTSLQVTLSDLSNICNGRIVRILPNHQIELVAPEQAKAIREIILEAQKESERDHRKRHRTRDR